MVIVLAATIFFVVAGAINLRDRLKAPPVPDDGVVWVQSGNDIIAESVRPGSPASRAGILKGDILRAINYDGFNYDEIRRARDVQIYLDEAGVGGRLTYTIERRNRFGISKGLFDGDLIGIEARPSNTARDIYLGIVGLVYLIVGLYILLKQRYTAFTLHFYLICLMAFIGYSYVPTFQGGFDNLVSAADIISWLFLAPLVLHFCAIFPYRKGLLQKKRWARWLIYLPAALLSLSEVVLVIPSDLTIRALNSLPNLRNSLDKASILQLAVFLVTSCALLVRTYFKATAERDAELRQQLKVIVWGMGIGATPFALIATPAFLFNIDLAPMWQAAAIGPLILIPISLGHAIRRYRLMDVDVIVRRSFVFASVTLFAVALMMSAVWWLSQTASGPVSTSYKLFLVAVMMLLALIFAPFKNWLQVRIDRLFYGERYNYRAGLGDFGRTLSSTTALDQLLSSLARRLSDMLSVKHIAILIKDANAASGFRIAYSVGLTEELKLPESFEEVLRNESAREGFALADNFEVPLESNPGRRELHYFVPCTVRDRMIAVVALGRTEDGDLLSSEDTEILRGLSGYVAVAIENSLLYQSEQERSRELERLKEFNESIIESINVGILTVDLDGRITNWNSELEQLLEIPRNEAMGKSITEVFDEDLIEVLYNVIGKQGWKLGEVRHIYKFSIWSRAGRQLVVNFSIAPLEAKDYTVTGALIAIEDVTDRVRLEEQIQQRDKLSSIGLLAAGVAHEVNTPLTGISSYTQMLLSQVPETDPKRLLLEKIFRQTQRASGIVNNLLNFSRTGSTQFTELDINKVLDDTLQLLEPQLHNTDIVVERDYGEGLPNTIGNASKLQQVFMNLILNAKDAMPAGGKLTLSTRLNETMLIIDVNDTGIGIAPENIAKIYDPFFTTKGVGSGTGLGLAVSYGIIQEHGGRINVTSKPGEGTQFRIKLPTAMCRVHMAASD